MVFQGAMTGGSLIWGSLAARTDVATALMVAAGGQVVALVLALIWRLPSGDAADLTPSGHWVEPQTAGGEHGDRPVMIEIEYRVAPEQMAAFVAALRRFRTVRRRDGAIRWDVWEDVAEPGRVVEAFVVESWLEHERQHARVTNADRVEQDLLNAFHIGGRPPVVRHLLRPF